MVFVDTIKGFYAIFLAAILLALCLLCGGILPLFLFLSYVAGEWCTRTLG